MRAKVTTINEDGSATLEFDPPATLVEVETLRRLVALLEQVEFDIDHCVLHCGAYRLGTWNDETKSYDPDPHSEDCELGELLATLRGIVGAK